MNISTLVFGWLMLTSPKVSNDSSLIAIRDYLANTIELHMPPPPYLDSGKKCFYTQQLLRVEVKGSRVKSICLSDIAPAWLQTELERQLKNHSIDFKKLDLLIKKTGIIKGDIIMPFVLQSETMNCILNQLDAELKEEIFKFKGSLIRGNVIFCKGFKFIVSTKLYYKSD